MNRKPRTHAGTALPYPSLYFLTLLETQFLARQTLHRLETLCRRYPEPELLEAVEQLRRNQQQNAPARSHIEAPSDTALD